ncbi:MAG: putative ABC transport system permease protein [Planctomycetota bacterium]|jgi:putative ABC transport system permease protein
MRRKLRTFLTLAGVACSVALFVAVESLNDGMDTALSGSESRSTLIVYRKNRYCPQTSNLPQNYTSRIKEVSGVASVLPVKVFLNNCRTSLEMITFHGAPVEDMLKAKKISLIEGDLARFKNEPDAALVGQGFAARRGLSVGDSFRFGAVNVKVVGLFSSSEATENEIILTHLEYLQRAGPVNRLGTVTQFEVRVDDPDQAATVAEAIDALFVTAEEPTATRPKIAFLESATRDLREILHFGRIFGLTCVLVALALMGGTVVMSVQERFSEFGVFRTLGYKARHIAILVLGESMIMGVVGAIFGVGIAIVAILMSNISIGVEGVQVAFQVSPTLVAKGIGMAIVCALVAAIIPAMRAARLNVVTALRSNG